MAKQDFRRQTLINQYISDNKKKYTIFLKIDWGIYLRKVENHMAFTFFKITLWVAKAYFCTPKIRHDRECHFFLFSTNLPFL